MLFLPAGFQPLRLHPRFDRCFLLEQIQGDVAQDSQVLLRKLLRNAPRSIRLKGVVLTILVKNLEDVPFGICWL